MVDHCGCATVALLGAAQLKLNVEDVGKASVTFRTRNVEKTTSAFALQATIDALAVILVLAKSLGRGSSGLILQPR
jgi:hypothetical protein